MVLMREKKLCTTKAYNAILQHLTTKDLHPNYTRLARKSGQPISSLFQCWKLLQKNELVMITIKIGKPEYNKVVQWKTLGGENNAVENDTKKKR